MPVDHPENTPQSSPPNSSDPPAQASAAPVAAAARRTPMRFLLVMLRALLIAYIAWCGVLYLLQDQIIFPTGLAPRVTTLHSPYRNATVLTVPVDGGEVYAYFVPAPTASSQRPAPAVIYFHGNAEVAEQQHDRVEIYHRAGVSVLIPEYRGYGRAFGRPSQDGIRHDAVGFYDQLRALPEVDPDRIMFHGRSIGGGCAIDLASERTPAALIVESTFISVAEFADQYFAPRFLIRHPFRSDRVLPTLTATPILIMHGSKDNLIPVSHGRRLHELVPRSQFIEFDAWHNDFPGWGNEEAYSDTILAFIGAIVKK